MYPTSLRFRHLLVFALAIIVAACGDTPEDEPDPSNNNDAPGEFLTSSQTRDLAPDVDEETASQLRDDNQDFAFSLMAQIREGDDDNIFFSPHSISIALAMTYAGATDQTHEQMGDVLRFTLDEENLHPAFNSLDLELAERSEVDVEDGDPPQLRVVNATWGQKDEHFSGEYLDTLAVHYGAGLRVMDFIEEHEESRETINAWVEEQTEERIKDLPPVGSITPYTRLVLTNAIYFLAGWQLPFSDTHTFEEAFTLLDGGEVDVPLMNQTEKFAYYEDDSTQAVSLPYVGEEMSLIALMPADAGEFESWEDNLDAAQFRDVVSGMSSANGTVTLPKFEVEGDYDLKNLFAAMGWDNFEQLNRMLEDESDSLGITDIRHKSFINLDEEGTEAAAATAVVGNNTSVPPVEFDLRFNRPFYYAVYDHPTDTILFFGVLMNPEG